jgi:hypothetical protein
LPLGDQADVEAGVEELAGRELAEREDRAVQGWAVVSRAHRALLEAGLRRPRGSPSVRCARAACRSRRRTFRRRRSGRAAQVVAARGWSGTAVVSRPPGRSFPVVVGDAEVFLEQRDPPGDEVGRHGGSQSSARPKRRRPRSAHGRTSRRVRPSRRRGAATSPWCRGRRRPCICPPGLGRLDPGAAGGGVDAEQSLARVDARSPDGDRSPRRMPVTTPRMSRGASSEPA